MKTSILLVLVAIYYQVAKDGGLLMSDLLVLLAAIIALVEDVRGVSQQDREVNND